MYKHIRKARSSLLFFRFNFLKGCCLFRKRVGGTDFSIARHYATQRLLPGAEYMLMCECSAVVYFYLASLMIENPQEREAYPFTYHGCEFATAVTFSSWKCHYTEVMTMLIILAWSSDQQKRVLSDLKGSWKSHHIHDRLTSKEDEITIMDSRGLSVLPSNCSSGIWTPYLHRKGGQQY